jgi:hypothetical protein
MALRPVLNETARGFRRDFASEEMPIEVKSGVLTLMFGVEMGRTMIAIEHPNDYAEKSRYDWHCPPLFCPICTTVIGQAAT